MDWGACTYFRTDVDPAERIGAQGILMFIINICKVQGSAGCVILGVATERVIS